MPEEVETVPPLIATPVACSTDKRGDRLVKEGIIYYQYEEERGRVTCGTEKSLYISLLVSAQRPSLMKSEPTNYSKNRA